jgi:hypothetical protein
VATRPVKASAAEVTAAKMLFVSFNFFLTDVNA